MKNIITNKDFCSNYVNTLSRTYIEGDCLGLGFTYSGLRVTFKGTSLKGKFISKQFDTLYNCPYITVFVDIDSPSVEDLNNAPMMKVTPEMDLVSGLPYGEHTVIIRKLSEANNHQLLVKELTTDGEFVENKPETKRFTIEFYGDSLTAAFGMLGKISDPNVKTSEQNASIGYANLTCAALNAEPNIVAMSGFPMALSPYLGDFKIRTVPTLFDCADGEPTKTYDELPKWDNKSHQPDLVVINLGANDRNHRNTYPEQEKAIWKAMEEKYHEFLDRLEKEYPNAKILMLSFHLYMRQGFDEVVKKVYAKRDHTRIYQLTISPKGRPSFGGAWHPTKIMNKKYAEALIPFIKENII